MLAEVQEVGTQATNWLYVLILVLQVAIECSLLVVCILILKAALVTKKVMLLEGPQEASKRIRKAAETEQIANCE